MSDRVSLPTSTTTPESASPALRGTVVAGQPLFVVAVASEAAALPEDTPVVVTGIGRINATLVLTDVLRQLERIGQLPSEVINIGTAGALSPGMSGVYRVSRVLLHDFSHASVAALIGHDAYPPLDLDGEEQVTLATGDTFVDDAETRDALAQQADLVDMEGYAIALVARHFDVPVQLLKIVSDSADAAASETWGRDVPRLARELARHELVAKHSEDPE